VQYDNPTLHIHSSVYMLHKYQTMIKVFHGCNNHQNCKSHELRMLNLYLLMYADDMVLFSESMHELQTMIDVVNLYSNEYMVVTIILYFIK
jgi:hypothetical protein